MPRQRFTDAAGRAGNKQPHAPVIHGSPDQVKAG
jgi:hypothetical protein